MEKNAKIYIAGHQGLVGSALVRALERSGYVNLLKKTKHELDLTNQSAVADFFAREKPEYVFLAAAKVGGILANDTNPVDFISENLAIQNNVITQSYKNQVKKLLFLGSSCVYPREVLQPIKEEYFLSGKLESTNEAYAAAKIAGIVECQSYNRQFGTNFISVMPTNTYGPNDNFDPETAHALPGILGKFARAKIHNLPEVVLWGTGAPKREFIYVDDLAEACIFLMNHYDSSEIINIGIGEDLSIKDLADLIQKIVGYQGDIKWDQTKPDGMKRKLLDVNRLHSLGWKHKTSLEAGIKKTYQWFLKNYETH